MSVNISTTNAVANLKIHTVERSVVSGGGSARLLGGPTRAALCKCSCDGQHFYELRRPGQSKNGLARYSGRWGKFSTFHHHRSLQADHREYLYRIKSEIDGVLEE